MDNQTGRGVIVCSALFFLFCCFFLFFEHSSVYQSISALYISAVTLIVFLIVLVLFFRSNTGLTGILLFLLVFACYMMLIALPEQNLKYILPDFAALCILFILSSIHWRNDALLLGGTLCGISGLILIAGFLTGYLLRGWNSNTIGLLTSYCAMCCVYPALLCKKGIYRLLSILLFISITVLVFFTESRTSFISLVLCYILMIVSAKERPLSFYLILFTVIAALTIIIPLIISQAVKYGIWLSFDQFSEKYFNKTIFTGREILWSRYTGQVYDSLLLGHGGADAPVNYHNLFLLTAYKYGVIGFSFYIGFFMLVMKKAGSSVDPAVRASLAVVISSMLQQVLESPVFPAKFVLSFPILILSVSVSRYLASKEISEPRHHLRG